MKTTLIVTGFLLIIAGSSFWYFLQQTSNSTTLITSFDDCAAAGYPIMESYPARCKTHSGQEFIQNVIPPTLKTFFEDIIKVNSLQPNDKIESPITITGQARGMWFFEAAFPITIEDSQGNTLATAVAQADGDWMTENFVPFSATLTFDHGTSTTGTLVFKKDNPSGLPENEAELRIPVKFN